MERIANREIAKFCSEHGVEKAVPSSPVMKRKKSNRVAGIAAPTVRQPLVTKKQSKAPLSCSTDLKMKLVARVRRLSNDDIGKLVKFVSQLPNASIRESEGEQQRIHIDNFDTYTCKKVIEFADSLLAEELEGPTKRAKTEEEVQALE